MSRRNELSHSGARSLFTATATPHPMNFIHAAAPAWVMRGGIRF